ncbi:ATP-binding protein [Nonomuraea sp. NPDC050478]|uniref:ATP-binding protein n=1 Tax=Nonomuraea sp. NPDC050478 TaxID=3364365 RepID=UPI0037AA7439
MRIIGDMRFPGRPEIMSDVRIYVTRWLVVELPEAADGGGLLDDLRLLATELAVNTIKHTISGRWSIGSFRVRMWLGAGRVRVEVTDQGWWSGPRLRDDPGGSGGRGLQILGAVAKKWGVKRRWFGRAVWFELPVSLPAAAHTAYLDSPYWTGTRPAPPDAGPIRDSAGARVGIAPQNHVEIVERSA